MYQSFLVQIPASVCVMREKKEDLYGPGHVGSNQTDLTLGFS